MGRAPQLEVLVEYEVLGDSDLANERRARAERLRADQDLIRQRLAAWQERTAKDPALPVWEQSLAVADVRRLQEATDALLTAHEQQAAWTGQADRSTLDIRRFGARGDGVADDAPAFRTAVEALREAGAGARLFLPRGDYRLAGHEDPVMRFALCLDDLTDVEIVGEPGTRLIAAEIGGVIRLERCRNVVLRHLILTHATLPFSQGTITAQAWGEIPTIDVRIDAGFPLPDEEPFTLPPIHDDITVRSASARHPVTGEPLTPHGSLFVPRVERLGPRDFRLHLQFSRKWADVTTFPDEIREGARLCLHSRGNVHGQTALGIEDSAHVTCEHVVVHTSYDFGIAAKNTIGTLFSHCAVRPAPGCLSGCNADGFHFSSNAFGPILEHCEVLNTMDDCLNVYCRAASVLDVLDTRTFLIQAYADKNRSRQRHVGKRLHDWPLNAETLTPGDPLLLIDPDTGEPTLLANIVATRAADWEGEALLAVEVDQPLPTLRTRRELGRPLVQRPGEFLRHDPAVPVEHFALPMARKSDGFVLRGCTFGQNTVTGAKMKASNALIMSNEFRRHGWCCLDLCGEFQWQEGLAPRHLLIADNTFANLHGLNLGMGYPRLAKGGGPRWIRDLEIRDNTFLAPDEAAAHDGAALRLSVADELCITGNRYRAGDFMRDDGTSGQAEISAHAHHDALPPGASLPPPR